MMAPDKQTNYAKYIACGCKSIHLSLQAIRKLFYDEELCEISHLHKDDKYFQIEVRFDMLTLTCLFDENNICESAFLFLNDLKEIIEYIEFCNQTYLYEKALNGWIAGNCLIRVCMENIEYSLLILPVPQKT